MPCSMAVSSLRSDGEGPFRDTRHTLTLSAMQGLFTKAFGVSPRDSLFGEQGEIAAALGLEIGFQD